MTNRGAVAALIVTSTTAATAAAPPRTATEARRAKRAFDGWNVDKRSELVPVRDELRQDRLDHIHRFVVHVVHEDDAALPRVDLVQIELATTIDADAFAPARPVGGRSRRKIATHVPKH